MIAFNTSDAHVFLVVTDAQTGSDCGMHMVISNPQMVIDNSVDDSMKLRSHVELSGNLVYQEVCSLEKVKELSGKQQ